MWFIPLFGIGPSIRELRTAVSGTDYSPHRLTRWLVALYIVTILQFFFFIAIRTPRTTNAEALAVLRRESLFTSLTCVAYVITTMLAANAILHTDKALTLHEPVR